MASGRAHVGGVLRLLFALYTIKLADSSDNAIDCGYFDPGERYCACHQSSTVLDKGKHNEEGFGENLILAGTPDFR